MPTSAASSMPIITTTTSVSCRTSSPLSSTTTIVGKMQLRRRCFALSAFAASLALLTIFIRPVMSWEFAVTTNHQIKFYDHAWQEITTAAHQFSEISAIAYDEANNTFYFNDGQHHNGSLFSLRLDRNNDAQGHRIELVAGKQNDEKIQGIAFDPLERMLYWTDAPHHKIMRLRVNQTGGSLEQPEVWHTVNDSSKPQGIAVDACRRQIYWTTWSPATIMTASLDKASSPASKVIVDTLDMPLGIVVDQYSSRLYWVEDLRGDDFSVSYSQLDGSDPQILVRGLHNAPLHLAVDREMVYWTDEMHRSVWRVLKNATVETARPENVLTLPSSLVPSGIIVHDTLLSAQANNVDCHETVRAIKERLELVVGPINATAGANSATTNPNAELSGSPVTGLPHNFCLNNGTLNVQANTCLCPADYKGDRCETNVCHNYCLNGDCYVSSTGYPKCRCTLGYDGDRCELDVCHKYCLNGGRCEPDAEDKRAAPVCHCGTSFNGQRCEIMREEEVCRRFCEFGETLEGYVMHDVCGNCSKNATETAAVVAPIPVPIDGTKESEATHCADSAGSAGGGGWNKTAIFVTVGVVCSLGLVFAIVMALRRFYQPIRPRIKKTFVVRNKMDRKNRTPLTCRPAPEQCEITIENCCNMNICDTPCFDPKTIQQEMNKENARKEDKYKLLSNMDGDLY